ncbi:MAG: site-specific DNA-methyltransferase [Gemmatimonadaceae bacterium]|nr:site-specific DNA-methyltransferase [Gemmatimonadaceae bacterium]
MRARAEARTGDATDLGFLDEGSVDLVVTSPPYPMIEMWDEAFGRQRPGAAEALAAGDGAGAFEMMHELLDATWAEVHRVLRPGGIACINIGDATRTLNGDFRLWSNHSRVLSGLVRAGFVLLPDILWRKPNNAPNKFLGSGMLPAGAYVTYEHEYVLIARKGPRREFATEEERSRRRESAFFWEERNLWFSDVWLDIPGAGQELVDEASRKRSAAFPFELAYRLVCMHSVKGDTVLDPFAGTGITAAAALASGRNAVSVELDPALLPVARNLLLSLPEFANRHLRQRLRRHLEFVERRTAEGGAFKHVNRNYGFPVVTSQERDLLLNDLLSVAGDDSMAARYGDQPQPEFVRDQPSGPVRTPTGRSPAPSR